MKEKYRIGHIGFAHVHIVDNTEPFLGEADRVQWIGAADLPSMTGDMENMETAMRGYNKKWLRDRNALPNLFDDYHKLLEECPDIVLINTENNMHKQVICDALDAGVTVVVEKPLAINAVETVEILNKVSECKGKLIVNWPSTWSASIRTAYRLMKEGAIGKPFKFTFRNACSPGPLSYGQNLSDKQKEREWWYHAGEGGGAMLDYCCYGCNLSRWFLGKRALSAFGMKENFNTPYGDADDYGIITAKYPEAVAILEGSWTTVHTGVDAGPVIFGTEGTLVTSWSIIGGKTKLYTNMCNDEPGEIMELDSLPEGRENLAREVIHYLDTEEPLHPTLDVPVNLDAMLLLDAGIRSVKSKKVEDI